MNTTGIEYFVMDNSDLFKLIKHFTLLAKQGDENAQNGRMYWSSIGTEPNLEMAIKYIKMSADQGNINAQIYLLFMLKNTVLLKKVICALLYKTNQNNKIITNKSKLAEHLSLFPGNDYTKAMRDFNYLTISN